jgi:DNA-binding NarL/FixJ family response regulator
VKVEDRRGDGPVRVLLADDHTMFREGLAGLLASHEGIEVVGQTTNDEGTVELARKTEPDVVVMQVQHPMERAREFLGRMAHIEPSPKIVICTMFEDAGYVGEFLGMGASAYLVKSTSVDHLVGAIRAAVFDPKGQNVVVGMPRKMLEEAKGGSEGVLSAREMEILLLVARGLSNRQVASKLRLSEATVKRHLANVYPKMGVSSRGEAVRKALSEEWITVRDIEGDG